MLADAKPPTVIELLLIYQSPLQCNQEEQQVPVRCVVFDSLRRELSLYCYDNEQYIMTGSAWS